MKTIIWILLLFTGGIGFSQNNPINFETGGFGSNWTWTVFENNTNPPLEIIANPDPTGINISATVAKFTALQTGQPFAGVESMHGSDIGTFSLSSNNVIVRIKVWKSVISDVGIKFATPEGASTGELKVPNTLINTWEELIFDFTSIIGEPSSNGIDQIIVFPDFDSRTSDNVIYFDEITFSNTILEIPNVTENSIVAYPNPVSDVWSLKAEELIKNISIYNISGQIIKSVSSKTATPEIDVSRLESGIYFAKIAFQSKEAMIKFIKN